MNNSRGRVVYVGPMYFPHDNAGARRVLGNCLSLMAGGYEVLVGSGQMPSDEQAITEEYRGIIIHSVGERNAEHKPVLFKHLSYTLMGKKTAAWLDTLDPKPLAVILYGGDIPYIMNLRPWCRKHGIPLIFEAVEWYDPANMPGGRFSPYRINFEITMRYLVPGIKNVIAISSYLENHYKALGCQTVCIPPTIDTVQYHNTSSSGAGDLITIGYTGTPGNKDLFDNYLEAFLRIDQDGKKFRFNVAGLTSDDILNYPSIKKRNIHHLPAFVNCVGKVSHSEAVRLIADSDFSILLRYPKRYANAGFPTKVVESMAMGTPVICNLTSDLHKYVCDRLSGIICDDHTVEGLIRALGKIEKMSSQEIALMSAEARKIAESSFDYRHYVPAIVNFIGRLKKL